MQKNAVIIFFTILLISPLIGWLFGIDARLDENRPLSKLQNISWQRLGDPVFYFRAESYFNDHFVFRAGFIKAKNWIDYHIFHTSPSSPLAYIGTDGWWYFRGELPDYLKNECNAKEQMRELARQLQDLEKVVEASGRRFAFMIAPNKSTIYPEHVGFDRPESGCNKSRYDLLLESFEEYPVENFIRLDTILIDAKRERQLYYLTDTHWNIYGAMTMSEALLRHLDPTSWNDYFPKVEFTNIKLMTDMVQRIALDPIERSDYAQTIAHRSKVKMEALKTMDNSLTHMRFTATVPIGEHLLPPTIIYRDSFMNHPLDLLKGSFEQFDLYSTHNLLHPETIEDLKHSRIVLLEIVERELGNLKIDPHGVESVLADH
jgi:hypothetical protein